MALAQPGARRAALPAGPRPAAAGGRGAAGAEGEEGGGRRAGNASPEGRRLSAWTTIETLYDPWHSALELQVMAEFYRTGFGMKMSPVYAGMGGDAPTEAGTKKYNHDDAVIVMFGLEEAVPLLAQLEAFINGDLAGQGLGEAVIIERNQGRGPAKRIILGRATDYYEPSHPDWALHEGALVFGIEQDADDKNTAKTATFFSRPKAVVLSDAEPGGVIYYPALQALKEALDSYIKNVARVDFASVRLLERERGAEQRASGASAPQPQRLTGRGAPGSLAAAAAAAGGPARGISPPAPAAAAAGSSAGPVSDADLDSALSAAGSPGF